MEGAEISRYEVLSMIARLAIATAASYFTVKLLVSAMDPTSRQKTEAKAKAKEIFKKMGIKKDFNLSEHELMIASQILLPGQLKTTWKDVAGLSSIIKEMRETVILPIQQRNRKNASMLIQPPKGILLHGPPGCGKTLLARAVSHEAGARFINLDVASLTDKWYGESQKLSSAVFSLAAKIQPCIIFIDEVDSFLRVRSSGDHEATAMMKAQFLQQWDGLATDHSHCILVMGASNRPMDIDRAILRRMPSSFHIPLPNVSQRQDIIKLVLIEENTTADLDVGTLAMQTEGFSGSDLRELCRTAAVYRLKHLINESPDKFDNCSDTEEEDLRPICHRDFVEALVRMRDSRVLDRAANALHKLDLD